MNGTTEMDVLEKEVEPKNDEQLFNKILRILQKSEVDTKNLTDEEIKIADKDSALLKSMKLDNSLGYYYLSTKILNDVQDVSLKSELFDVFAKYAENTDNYLVIVKFLSDPNFSCMNLGKYQTSEYIGGLFQKAQVKNRNDAYSIAIRLSLLEKKRELSILFKNDPPENDKFSNSWKERFSQIVETDASELFIQLKNQISDQIDKKNPLDEEDQKYLVYKAKFTLESSCFTEGGVGDHLKGETTKTIYIELAKSLLTYLDIIGGHETLKKHIQDLIGVKVSIWSKIKSLFNRK